MKPVFVKSWSTSGDADRPPRGGRNEMMMDDSAGKEQSSSGVSGRDWISRASTARSSPSAAGRTYDGGSVTLSGRFPACRVGAAYDRAAIGHGHERYEMSDLVVTGCARESMSLNFAKVKVRGWNPEKKEE